MARPQRRSRPGLGPADGPDHQGHRLHRPEPRARRVVVTVGSDRAHSAATELGRDVLPRPPRAEPEAPRAGDHPRARPRPVAGRGRRADRGRRRLRRPRQARLGHGAGHGQPASPSSSATPSHGIPVVLGGTLAEVAIRQDRSTASSSWMRELGHAPRRDLRRLDRAPARAQARDHRAPGRRGLRRALRGRLQGPRGDHGPVPLGRADRGRARRRGLEGHRRGARERDGGPLPRLRRGPHGPDRRDRPRRSISTGSSSRRRRRTSRSGSSSPSAARPTSATSRPTRSSRSRRCASACARTRSGSRDAVILLARHGETDDNRPPLRFQGQRDTPLNDTGRRAGAELAERVGGEAIATLWSSPLVPRARDGGDRRRARSASSPRSTRGCMEGWRGRWEGLLFEDVERDEPEGWAALARRRPGLPLPRRRVAGRAAGPRAAVDRRRAARARSPRCSSATAAASAPSSAPRDPRGLDRVPRVGRPQHGAGAGVTRLAAGDLRAARAGRPFGAFFVAQRLKRQPPLILRTNFGRGTSRPTATACATTCGSAVRLQEGRRREHLGRQPTTATSSATSSPTATSSPAEATATWDGRDDSGHRAPDGFYRFRLGLRDSGRSVNIPFETRLDDCPAAAGAHPRRRPRRRAT